MPNLTKLLIIVESGVIQQVLGNDPEMDVIVIDYDCREENPNSRELPSGTADVWPIDIDPIPDELEFLFKTGADL